MLVNFKLPHGENVTVHVFYVSDIQTIPSVSMVSYFLKVSFFYC